MDPIHLWLSVPTNWLVTTRSSDVKLKNQLKELFDEPIALFKTKKTVTTELVTVFFEQSSLFFISPVRELNP